jgi:hypothetical protein
MNRRICFTVTLNRHDFYMSSNRIQSMEQPPPTRIDPLAGDEVTSLGPTPCCWDGTGRVGIWNKEGGGREHPSCKSI